MTPDEALDRVADELLFRGWTTGSLGSGNGEKCLVGAVNFVTLGDVHGIRYDQRDLIDDLNAVTEHYEREQLRLRVYHLLNGDERMQAEVKAVWPDQVVKTGGAILPFWNDAIAKDVEDVVDLCRQVAKRFREEAQ